MKLDLLTNATVVNDAMKFVSDQDHEYEKTKKSLVIVGSPAAGVVDIAEDTDVTAITTKSSIKLFIYKCGPTHEEMKMFCRPKLRYLTYYNQSSFLVS